MDAQDFRSLQEAYREVVEEGRDKRLLAHLKGEEEDENSMMRRVRPRRKPMSPEQQKKYIDKYEKNEEVDIYDIILSHLLDEGYAETPEAAEVIMVNMSEEWRKDIVEELTGPRKKRALEIGTPLARRIALGREGQPLERRDRSGKVTMSTTQKGPTKRGGAGLKGRIKSDWYGHDESRGGT